MTSKPVDDDLHLSRGESLARIRVDIFIRWERGAPGLGRLEEENRVAHHPICTFDAAPDGGWLREEPTATSEKGGSTSCPHRLPSP